MATELPIVVAEPLTVPIEKLCEDFDPARDYWDRRLLYEVTGVRLNDSEYRGDDTSDEEELRAHTDSLNGDMRGVTMPEFN